MAAFFILNTKNEILIPELFSGYIIYYSKSNNSATAEVQLDLFKKLIENGLNLKTDNFIFIDVASSNERISMLKKRTEIKKCFLFGVNENQIGVNITIPFYELVQFNSIEFIKSDAPEQLSKDASLKKRLWQQLQLSFKLN